MITLEHIKFVVEKYAGVKDLKQKSKKNRLPVYRGIYCMLAIELTGIPVTRIGRFIDITRPAVIYWRDNAKDIIDIEPGMADKYYRIKQEIKQTPHPLQFQSAKEIDQEASQVLQKMTG